MHIHSEYNIPTNKKTIKDWKEDERPRERLLKHGAHSLSDAELLALLIGSGTKGYSAIDASRDLLSQNISLNNLASCDISILKTIKGMGDAKAVRLAACFEIGRRIESRPIDKKEKIVSAEQIFKIYAPKLRDERVEKFFSVLLNSSNQIIRDVLVSQGSLNSSIVHPREVFKTAISESAAAIILMHNHPSGNPEPSREDIQITKELMQAGKLLDIQVLDHIIIAANSFSSLNSRGLL